MTYLRRLTGILLGLLLVILPVYLPQLTQNGFAAIGPILGITFIVFSLFGELPSFLSWTQKIGSILYPGIALGALLLLIPLLVPSGPRGSSFFAWSPSVWLAYISIILVGISFENSTIPLLIYQWCKKIRLNHIYLFLYMFLLQDY